MTQPIRGNVLPSPNRLRYDPENEAQMRRALERALLDILGRIDSLTPDDVALIAYGGGEVSVTYDDGMDGGSFDETFEITYDGGSF
jgi:hypothetical protein